MNISKELLEKAKTAKTAVFLVKYFGSVTTNG